MYIVRISGVQIESMSPGHGLNHFWNVLVHATSGELDGGFTFD